MNETSPETFGQYFRLKLIQLAAWVKPNREDNILIKALKLLYKTIVIILLIILSPVLLVGLTLAFIGAF